MAMARWLHAQVALLRPWLVLVPAVLGLGLLQGLLVQAPGSVLVQRLVADALMLLRALPLWCLLLWPALALPVRGQAVVMALNVQVGPFLTKGQRDTAQGARLGCRSQL